MTKPRRLIFAGDTHGPLNHLSEVPDDAIVLHLGDLELQQRPLEEALPAGIRDRFFWIPGNHEYDKPAHYENAFTPFGRGCCLDRTVRVIGGMRVAGLGGVFAGSVWYPKASMTPAVLTREQRIQKTPRRERVDGGLSIKQRAYIYEDDFLAMANLQADVLVAHEAPLTHEHGFFAIGELARRMGAHTIVHGHLHVDYAIEWNGLRVIGVGLRGLVDLQGHILRPGEPE